MRCTTLTALAASCALLAGLAACGGDPEPKFTKSATPTHPVSSSPTPTQPTPPEMPAAARKHTVAGAKAFTRYLVTVLDYVSVTIDSAPLAAIAGDQCGACHAILADQERLADRGAKVAGGRETLATMSVVPMLRGASTSPMRARVSIKHTRQTITYPHGKSDTYAAGTTRYELTLSPVSSGWEVASWTILD